MIPSFFLEQPPLFVTSFCLQLLSVLLSQLSCQAAGAEKPQRLLFPGVRWNATPGGAKSLPEATGMITRISWGRCGQIVKQVIIRLSERTNAGLPSKWCTRHIARLHAVLSNAHDTISHPWHLRCRCCPTCQHAAFAQRVRLAL